jgi:UDP-glucuronate 4-epimerase
MKILITGGAGFIGSHLAERLLASSCEVVCLDNFNNFYNPKIKRENIKNALMHDNYTLMEGDILDVDFLNRVFKTGFDSVVHLAAYAGVRPSIEQPSLYQKVNLEGTVNLLEQCRLNKIDKFVFASSSSVYGGRTKIPFLETDSVTKPISPYAATKAAGELLCHAHHHLFDIKMNLLRFFTVYGPRQRPEMAIHLFARQMLQNKKIKIFGNGLSSRDYTYIDDIIDGIVAAIDNLNGFEIINLGGSSTTSLNRLVELIGKRLNVTPDIEKTENQPGDVPITNADITKAKKLLNYEPKTAIESGIDRFCTWLETRDKNLYL